MATGNREPIIKGNILILNKKHYLKKEAGDDNIRVTCNICAFKRECMEGQETLENPDYIKFRYRGPNSKNKRVFCVGRDYFILSPFHTMLEEMLT
jgi:hypothetical protein